MVVSHPSKVMKGVRFSYLAPNIMTDKVYYQHRYGGIYTVDFPQARSTVDKSEWVVYTHVYPFEVSQWLRPKAEWNDGRFKVIEGMDLRRVLDQPREVLQAAINKAKQDATKGK